MDRNEQNLKIEELKTAMHNRDFEKAVDIADSLDLKKIKDNNFLSLVADAYEVSRKYDEAKKVLLIAYENTNAGRQLAYRLCLISVKMKEFDEAMEFYEDFVEMAPRDTARYILKYKIAKAQNAPIEKLIKILEEYVNIDMEEKWAYELAKLYHIAGDKEKCVDMCNEISLWFADGKYVAKAMELKGAHKPDEAISMDDTEIDEGEENDIQAIGESINENKDNNITEIEINDIQEIEEADFSDIKINTSSDDKFNTMDIQAVIADGMKEVVFDDNTNVHEGQQATKIAPDFTGSKNDEPVKENINPGEVQEITGVTDEIEEIEEIEETDVEAVEDTKEQEVETVEEPQGISQKEEQTDDADEVEPIKGIQDVEDILRQLQARGILKAETVQQAVNIIDEAGKGSPSNSQNVSTLERWEEDSAKPTEEAVEEEEIKLVEPKIVEDVETETTDAVQENIDEQIKEPIEEKFVVPVEKADEPVVIEKVAEKLEQMENVVHTAEIKVGTEPTLNGVPVLDLDFEAPKVEIPNDVVEKSAKASDDTTEFHSDKQLSVNVEIISGTDWKQDETTKKPVENLIIEKVEEKKEEPVVDKASTKNIDLTAKPIMPKPESKAESTNEKEVPVLTDEELSTFRNYLNVEGFASNIREVLQELIVNYTPNGKSTDGNVIIMGDEKTGKTTLAIETIKLVNKKRGRRNRKLAKVDASALNRRGFRNSLNKLLGSDLIIENAHNLGVMTLSEVVDASGMYTDDMLIVLEGETEQMEKMLNESPRLAEVFNHVIRIREYDIKEWVEYGKEYALEQGYKMDDMANLAFFKAIDDFFGANKGIGQDNVETIVNDAIERSRRIRRKLSGIFSSKKDEEGLYTLVESDFNVK